MTTNTRLRGFTPTGEPGDAFGPITFEGFARWVRDLPLNVTVGKRRSATDCPLARYLIVRGYFVAVVVTRDSYQYTEHVTDESDQGQSLYVRHRYLMPRWAALILRRCDYKKRKTDEVTVRGLRMILGDLEREGVV